MFDLRLISEYSDIDFDAVVNKLTTLTIDCGNDELNRYLRSTARQHLEKGMSRTFVLIDDNNPTMILGYYTLAACEIHAEKLPRKYSKKYPSKVPAAKLARLAVSEIKQYVFET